MAKAKAKPKKNPEPLEVKKPVEGELTKGQRQTSMISMLGQAWGYGQAPAGNFDTYRRMRGNPTIAIARIAAAAPVKSANISWQGEDQEAVDFVRDNLEPIWSQLIHNILYALDYGYQPFEKVWEYDGESGLWRYRKIKPLEVTTTKIKMDKDTGAFAGLQQKGVELGPEKSFVFTYDSEAGNFYGRSRNENCREVWHNWNEVNKKVGMYVTKAAGIIPMVIYPEGRAQDESGAETENWQIARRLLASLGKGNGVAIPMQFSEIAQDLAARGVDITQLMSWQIRFLETKGQHGGEFVSLMEHYEKQMLRGWLVLERTVTEGKHGTLAEAASHAELALVIAGQLLNEIIRYVNWYLVDPLLMVNFGTDAMGSVWVEPEAMDDGTRNFTRELMLKVLSAPPNIDLLLTMLDVDALLDQTGLPKREDTSGQLSSAAQLQKDRLAEIESGNGEQLPKSILANLEARYGELFELTAD